MTEHDSGYLIIITLPGISHPLFYFNLLSLADNLPASILGEHY
jgi:hypothetical protein